MVKVLEIDIKQIDNNTWYIDGKVKYYINYDDEGRWTGQNLMLMRMI